MLNDDSPEFRVAQRELESALFDIKCIGRTLVMLTEGARRLRRGFLIPWLLADQYRRRGAGRPQRDHVPGY